MKLLSKWKIDTIDDIIYRIDNFINFSSYINEANHYLIEKDIVDIYDPKAREVFAGMMKARKQNITASAMAPFKENTTERAEILIMRLKL